MDLSQDVLLPILLVTIAANVAIVIVLLASGRMGRDRGLTSSAAQASGFERAIMSTSYSDRTAPDTWPDRPTADDGMHAEAIEDTDAVEVAEASDSDTADAAVPGSTIGELTAAPEPDPAPDTNGGIDSLTGLPDAAAFHRLVADEEARMARYHHPATVIVFELDGFDRLVERLGADAGDRLIPPVADTLQRLGRGADHVARLGNGRFAALLPETDEIAAINYIERVRRACELWLESGAIALRLAIGWAGTSGDPSLSDALRTATERMYVELRRNARRAGDDEDLIAS
jgi:diguanylate cyclase (GGDEF)-like protein